MNHSITHQITESKKKHARRSVWRRIVTCMACVVVFCTVYALILPAITMEQEVFCGYEEHIHTNDCFRQDSEKTLICSTEHLGLHVHGEDCYDAADVLICGELDYVAHAHDDSCCSSDGTLVCTLPEIEAHTHSETCYSVSDETAPLHTHTDACSERVKGDLVCTEQELETHKHAGACFAPGETLLCTLPEDHTHVEGCLEYSLVCTQSTDPHSHDSGCYELTDELSCTIPAEHAHQDQCWEVELVCTDTSEEHVHGEGCHSETLICSIPENHVHLNSCYKSSLICDLDEGSAHEHSTECYGENPTVICAIEEQHKHTDSCYESVLVCELPEQEGHSHSDDCYSWEEEIICGLEEGQPEPTEEPESVLICELPTPAVHVHSESCFNSVALGCTEDHDHSEDCEGFTLICEEQVHEHELSCYSDPEADVESETVWEKTVERVNLTGDSRKDLLAIAQTQLGYAESTRNYDVWEDQTMHGYTRYGDWYGDKYGDWCAMFVSFCLNYANVDNIPYHSNVTAWIEDISQTEIDLYRGAGEYTPVPGDLIFFDLNENEDADHIGIVEEIIPETDQEKAKIKVLEGNSSDRVQYVYYRVDHPAILGYAELPEKLTDEEIAQVAAVEELIDALPADADADDLTSEQISDIEYADQQYLLLTEAQKEYVDNADRLAALKNLLSEPEQPSVEYNCGITEEHTHGEDCYDEEGNLVCELMAHVHTDDCIKTATDEDPVEQVTYYCGLEEHTHGEDCYDEDDNLICDTEPHAHSDACLTEPSDNPYHCGNEEHAHSDDCYDEDGNLVCDVAEHSHIPACSELEGEALTRVMAVIEAIDAMPSADEIDAEVEKFQALDDEDGEIAYLERVFPLVQQVYLQYDALGEGLQPYVTNADKLMDLEYIWSVATYATTTDRPTIYQINSYVDSSNGDAVMVFGGTVAEKVTYKFLWWYAIKVEADSNGDLRVVEILQPGSNSDKSNYRANNTGFVLLFHSGSVIPDAVVGDYVTVHFTIPASGVLKSEGYGTVSFTESKSGIYSDAPTKIGSASTRDFVELNLYDYNGNINTNYWNEAKDWWYPGFQWNGGAYQKYGTSNTSADLGIPNYYANRYYVDSIDFGNSLITNFTRGEGTSTYYTKAINSTNVAKASASYSGNSPINWIYGNDTEGYTNKPIGTSTTDITDDPDVMHDTLVNGYPAMTNKIMLDYLFKPGSAVTKLNTASIDGLFLYDEESGAYTFNSRENHAEYVSGENRFQLYDEIITPNFILYPFGNFLPLNTIDDSSKATQVSAFNYSGGMRNYVERLIADLKNDAEGLGSYWNDTQRQLAIMLEEYKESWTYAPRTINSTSNNWENVSAANAIRDYFWKSSGDVGNGPTDDTDFITGDHLSHMYNIDWDIQTNFFFGMEMKMNFYQPKGGMTGKDKNGDGEFDYPMEFYFTGDDDVWVYIDDVLFLDLSGIHRHVGGKIDFVNGKVHYYALDTENGGDVSESTLYKTFTFEEILSTAGKSTDGLNSKGTFEDYTTHSFNFYYMERGSGSSICRLNFNFPLLRQNTLSVEKELSADADIDALGNPDFLFQVLDVDDNGTPDDATDDTRTNTPFLPEGWAYSLYDTDGTTLLQEIVVNEKYVDGRVKTMDIKDANGIIICTETYNGDGTLASRTGTGLDKVLRIGTNGIFALKAGQRAEFVGLPESWGKYYVRELLDGTIVDQYGKITVSGTATDRSTVEVGGISYTGEESPILDMTNGSSTFRFNNKITTAKLGSLSLTKQVERYTPPTRDVTYYRMYVLLDDAPLAAGLKLTATKPDGSTREVTVGQETVDGKTVSYVDLLEGETVLIPNILSGTRFKVWESEASAKGYKVGYDAINAEEEALLDNAISGIVRVNTEVSVTITNSENGDHLQIPVVKRFQNFAAGTYEYTFTLTEVDAQGSKLEGGTSLTKTAQVTSDGQQFLFDPITYLRHSYDSLPATHYYLIEEAGEGTSSLPNSQQFLVKVTVREDENSTTEPKGIVAEITEVSEKSGDTWTVVTDQTATFTNILTGDLTLEKQVKGADSGQLFGFIIKLDSGASGANPMPTEYKATAYAPDGTATDYTFNFGDDLEFHVGLNSGERLVIHGIPIGAQWTITEGTVVYDENGNFQSVQTTKPDGYIVSYQVNSGSVTTDNVAGGNITAGGTVVVYTNSSTYELPETGGAGTHLYTMGGLLLMAAAILLYIHNKRRKEVYSS